MKIEITAKITLSITPANKKKRPALQKQKPSESPQNTVIINQK